MIGVFNENRDLRREVARLEQVVKNHETAYKALEDQFNDRTKELDSVSRKQPVAINFFAMNAFSVERIMFNDMPTTVIGYKVQNSTGDRQYQTEIREWFLHCDEEVHAYVIEKFNEYINRKPDYL